MDYGDFREPIDNAERIKKIEEIYRLFEIGADDMIFAKDAADTNYPDLLYSYYFFGGCINAARDILREHEGEAEDYVYELVDEYADSEVPHQTYVLWMIWVDLGYDESVINDFGYEYDNNLYIIPQFTLYEYAQRIINAYINEALGN